MTTPDPSDTTVSVRPIWVHDRALTTGARHAAEQYPPSWPVFFFYYGPSPDCPCKTLLYLDPSCPLFRGRQQLPCRPRLSTRVWYCLQVQLLSQAGAVQEATGDAVEVVGSTSLPWVSSSTASPAAAHQPPCPPSFDQAQLAVAEVQHRPPHTRLLHCSRLLSCCCCMRSLRALCVALLCCRPTSAGMCPTPQRSPSACGSRLSARQSPK